MHGCHQCNVSNDSYSNPDVNIKELARTTAGIKLVRQRLAGLTGKPLTDASMESGVVPDTPGLLNPLDELFIDTNIKLPPEILHTNARVSRAIT